MLETREDLAKYFAELGFTSGVEVGVNRGYYSRILCEANPKLKLYGVDPWDLLGPGRNDLRIKRYAEAQDYLSGVNAELIKKFSVDAAKDFENESLDFVYIDGNHEFDDVMRDIIEWTPKIKKGGIVSGHDYDSMPGCYVRDAVDVYARIHKYDVRVLPKPDGEWKTRAGLIAQGKTWWFLR